MDLNFQNRSRAVRGFKLQRFLRSDSSRRCGTRMLWRMRFWVMHYVFSGNGFLRQWLNLDCATSKDYDTQYSNPFHLETSGSGTLI
jgi:hypothetical protein